MRNLTNSRRTVWHDVELVIARKKAEYEELSRITGKSIEELDEDLTASDPKEEQ